MNTVAQAASAALERATRGAAKAGEGRQALEQLTAVLDSVRARA